MEALIRKILKENDSKCRYPSLNFDHYWNLVERDNSKRKKLFEEWAEGVVASLVCELADLPPTSIFIGRSWNRHHFDKDYTIIIGDDVPALRKQADLAYQKLCLTDRIGISNVDSFLRPGSIEQKGGKIFAFTITFDDDFPGMAQELVIDRRTLKIIDRLIPRK